MPKLFEDLRARLLVAGVAPRHIRRYIAELEDHLADLRTDAPDEATAAARLGDVDTLAQPMLSRPEFRSWTARAPWATLIGGPIVAMAAASAACFAVFAAIILSIKAMNPGRAIEPMWLQNMVQGVVYVLVFIAPILIGWATAAQAVERRLAPHWPIAGLLVFAFVTGTLDIGVNFPKIAGEHGELRIGWGLWGDFSTQSSGIRIGLNFILTATPYLLWRRRVAALAT